MSAHRVRRLLSRAAGIATASAATVALAACWVPGPSAGPSAAPTVSVAPETSSAEPFYEQAVTWVDCGDGFECATVAAPLDWADPAAGQIELSMSRHGATNGRPLGSLFVNPGGPGGSGFDFVRYGLETAVGPELIATYDVIGFDPRGVGRSTPVTCLDDAGLDDYFYAVPEGDAGSDEWIAGMRAQHQVFAEGCLANTGDALATVDTDSTARDLDLLRALVGAEALDYLGYSYGTFLGARYAELFPDRVGRMVLDGAIDPTLSFFEIVRGQVIGFDRALRAYLADCLTQSNCPFQGLTVDQAVEQIAELMDRVRDEPLEGSDGRVLGANVLVIATITPLYNRASWPLLSTMLADVSRGSADMAIRLADSYFDRDSEGVYSSNTQEAFAAINCLDYSFTTDVERMRAEAAELDAVSPVFGLSQAYGDLQCGNWPVPSVAQRGAVTAEGAPPIVVIGTTNDPATPYEWAVGLAEQLSSGILVTYTGDGHTAYNKSNECVQSAVDDYFVSGTPPVDGLQC